MNLSDFRAPCETGCFRLTCLGMSQSSRRADASCPFQSALLLTDDEVNASADRTALRGAGVRQVRLLTSGADAARYLADSVKTVLYPVTEVIFCLPQLADMNAAEFAGLIRAHPLLAHIPLLAVTAEHGQKSSLQAAGFSGVLQRPFTTNQLATLLAETAARARTTRTELIAALRRAGTMPSLLTFEQTLKSYTPPDRETMSCQDCCLYGKSALRIGRWREAIPYLLKASTDPVCRGEASALMAALWSSQGEPERAKACLRDSVRGYAGIRAWDRMKLMARRFAADFPEEASPLLPDVARKAARGQTGALVTMLPHLREILPENALLAALLQGCQGSPTPDQALATLREALKKAADNGAFPEGSRFADTLGALSGGQDAADGFLRKWFTFDRRKGRKSPASQETSSAARTGSAGEDGTGRGASENSRSSTRETPRKKKGVQPAEDAPDRTGGAAASLSRPNARRGRKGISLSDESAILPLPLANENSLAPSRLPSALGEALTVIRGTMRLYRDSK